jgi:ABC-type spermidine/putrescine transport system permease subunit II
MTLRVVHRALLTVTVIFLLAPALMTVALSFSNTPYFAWPPVEWGTRQYVQLVSSSSWAEVTARSLIIALAAAAVSVAAAASLLMAVNRTSLRFGEALQTMAMLPLLIPGVAFAVALYEMFARWRLIDTFAGIILAHAVLTLPIAVLVVAPAMRSLSRDLELVAMTLGASRLRAWWGITLRLLAPAVMAATIIAFLTSFDEAVLVSFVSGPSTTTLPKAILDSVATGVDPTVSAIATLLMALTAGLLLLADLLRSRGRT